MNDFYIVKQLKMTYMPSISSNFGGEHSDEARVSSTNYTQTNETLSVTLSEH